MKIKLATTFTPMLIALGKADECFWNGDDAGYAKWSAIAANEQAKAEAAGVPA